MTDESTSPASVDIKTLERLAALLDEDAQHISGLHPSAMRSAAEIIRRAIGAPLMWPSRKAGAAAADRYFPGSPDLRHAFNGGVKWAVENYQPSVEIIKRQT